MKKALRMQEVRDGKHINHWIVNDQVDKLLRNFCSLQEWQQGIAIANLMVMVQDNEQAGAAIVAMNDK